MLEFLQTYGTWIVFGIFFVLMLRMHGGGGCGMGHQDHTDGTNARPTDANARSDETSATASKDRHATGCH